MQPHGSSYTWAYQQWSDDPPEPDPYEPYELAQQMGKLELDEDGNLRPKQNYLQTTLSPRTKGEIEKGPGAWLFRALEATKGLNQMLNNPTPMDEETLKSTSNCSEAMKKVYVLADEMVEKGWLLAGSIARQLPQLRTG